MVCTNRSTHVNTDFEWRGDLRGDSLGAAASVLAGVHRARPGRNVS